ncbi:DUF4865 domain-containing protein [Labrys miyagiensis]|uniref:DUF4865 domain-containing protein n=1 Tax=Labrys miyagiensis TaxID=346912 RepID=A0ABQ6CIZ4_9HYPH|nr:DUF4865 family protein [Labrys miyagiensis]GLS18689.1 DUF4865 domain-containing protein [Labrys miyagiensis]
MYAMHYAITLPAEYDMGIIRERIATKGPLLDNLPGLGLKAYLVRERGVAGSPVNQYATFYLWASAEGMGGFLWGGRGFGGIVSSFGRPPVRHWIGAACLAGAEPLSAATAATIREEAMPPDIDPSLAVSSALEQAAERVGQPGVCLSALAVDPQSWQIVHFALSAGEPAGDAGTRYEVGHISRPEISAILQA